MTQLAPTTPPTMSDLVRAYESLGGTQEELFTGALRVGREIGIQLRALEYSIEWANMVHGGKLVIRFSSLGPYVEPVKEAAP